MAGLIAAERDREPNDVWDDVSGFELRMTRVGRQFAAYALFPSEPPMPFSLPVPAVAKYLGLHDDQAPQ